MVGVEQWAEIRRMHFVERLSIREIARRTGLRPRTRSAARCAPRARRATGAAPGASKLDPFKEEIHRLLRADATHARHADPRADRRSSATRAARRSSTTTCARCGRCFAAAAHLPAHRLPARRDLPVRPLGAARARSRSATARPAAAGSSPARLGYSRAGAGALVFSKQAPDISGAWAAAWWRLGALPETLVWDREGALARRRRPPDRGLRRLLRRAAGRLALLRGRATPQAKGVARAPAALPARPTSSPAAASPTELDFQASSTRWFEKRANRAPSPHASAPCPPSGWSRSASGCGRCPSAMPDTDRRFVDARAPAALPALRHQRLLARPARWPGAGSRSRVSQREITAVALDTGELVASPPALLRQATSPSPTPPTRRCSTSCAASAAAAPRSRSSCAPWPATTP